MISTASSQVATLETVLPDTSVCEECEGKWYVRGVCGRVVCEGECEGEWCVRSVRESAWEWCVRGYGESGV